MTSAAPLRLGAFELVAPISHGGMAEVFRGLHRASDTAVAVKLVTLAHARTRSLREALRNEVRAMARLDHPGVVRVHDYGEISEDVAAASEGTLAPGSPYLVMELADGGTLRHLPLREWAAVRDVLEQLLAALAHAHARGVVHRDLKPSNVLVSAGRLKLSDFGIAHALSRVSADAAAGTPLSAGTASFMAPEQVLGLHRDEGPWTDLYALGCLAHLLVTGRLPFTGESRDDLFVAHCLATPPRLVPRLRVPRELETWIHVLLAKRPRDRFACAADALGALRSLGEPYLEAQASAPSSLGALPTATSGTSEITHAATSGMAAVAPRAVPSPEESLREATERMRGHAEPASAETPLDSPLSITGIGLGVHGLRTIPLIGREREQAFLLSRLDRVRDERRPRAVVLRGREGQGKTRLAQWLVEHAIETGHAYPLWSAFGTQTSDAVARAIARALGVEGLSLSELATRLGDHPTEPALDALPESARAEVLSVLAPSALGHATQPSERFRAIVSLLSVLGARRPVRLILDDAHLAREALGLAEHLLRLRSGAPSILLVLTVREETLDERSSEAAMLEALERGPRVERVTLGPLDDEAHASLIGAILGLEEGLARRVAERTAGSPLFAIQLVGDWVQRGELVAGKRGFRLREGATPSGPDHVHELWSARIERFVDAFPEDVRGDVTRALELAALLGRAVPLSDLRAACGQIGVALPEGVTDALAAQRLALVGRTSLSFVHGMLVESLERRASEAGRLEELHRACARALDAQPRSRGTNERIGRHLAAAGAGLDAAPLLFEAARERLTTCEFEEVHALSSLADEGLARGGIAQDDPLRAAGYLLRAEALIWLARLDDAAGWLDRAERVSPPANVTSAMSTAQIGAQVLQLRARIARKQARNELAAALYHDAYERMIAAGNQSGAAHCLHGLGDAEKLLGRLDDAVEHHVRALALFDSLGDALFVARVRGGLADIARRRGEHAQAQALLEDVALATERLGNPYGTAFALNALGDIARTRGELTLAEQRYREALALLESLASEEAAIVALNLGLVQLAAGRFDAARASLAKARRDLEEESRAGYLIFVLVALWMCDAGQREWASFDALAREVDESFAALHVVDDDLAWALDETAKLTLAAGEHERAVLPRRLAIAQWQALGRSDRARALGG